MGDDPRYARSDDAERFNAIALRDGAVPAAAGASSMPPADQEPPEPAESVAGEPTSPSDADPPT